MGLGAVPFGNKNIQEESLVCENGVQSDRLDLRTAGRDGKSVARTV